MYLFEENGMEIPVICNDKIKSVKINAEWDLFEVEANPSIPTQKIMDFINSKKGWMELHIKKNKSFIDYFNGQINTGEYVLQNNSKELLRKKVNDSVSKYEDLRGKPHQIYIRQQLNRAWASCTTKRNITFNYIVGFLPNHLIDYVTYHELCHLTEMKHNSKFYSLIKEEFPQHEREDNELNIYHYRICHKLHDDKLKLIKGT